MMGPYGCLVTKAIHEKHTHKEYIGVDACAVNLDASGNVWSISSYYGYGKRKSACVIINMILQVLFVRIMINLQLTVCFRRLIWEIWLVIHDTGAHGLFHGI